MEKKDIRENLEKIDSGAYNEADEQLAKYWLFKLNAKKQTGHSDESLEEIGADIWAGITTSRPGLNTQTPERSARKLWPRLTIAASLIGLMGIGFFLYQTFRPNTDQTSSYAKDIAPGKNGATLTLASGKKILITGALAGNIAEESGVRITKSRDGQLIYEVTGSRQEARGYNTLSTTRGEQTQVRLPDGSLVYLNAQSELRYPVNFASKARREVALSGEGYFEVAKDKAHPFIVITEKQSVEVLGTHFNISAYPGAARTTTTLLEGSVKVTAPLGIATLSPDQQATLDNGSLKVAAVDAELALDWKNGFFYFSSEPLESIMDKLARWYNLQVSYSDPALKQKTFTGTISRFKHLSEAFGVLKKTGGVTFSIEGNTVTVERPK